MLNQTLLDDFRDRNGWLVDIGPVPNEIDQVCDQHSWTKRIAATDHSQSRHTLGLQQIANRKIGGDSRSRLAIKNRIGNPFELLDIPVSRERCRNQILPRRILDQQLFRSNRFEQSQQCFYLLRFRDGSHRLLEFGTVIRVRDSANHFGNGIDLVAMVQVHRYEQLLEVAGRIVGSQQFGLQTIQCDTTNIHNVLQFFNRVRTVVPEISKRVRGGRGASIRI